MSHQEKIFNLAKHCRRRVDLRKRSTLPERVLWQRIRNKQFGVKFRRQQGIGKYIADFYCTEEKLVIEIDGDSHYYGRARIYDQRRDAYFCQLGLRVLRFTNVDVMQNIDGVLSVLLKSLWSRRTPP